MAKKKKGELEKRLEALAREHGATLSVEGDAFRLSRPGERNSLFVDEDTEQHLIERYLRGANA